MKTFYLIKPNDAHKPAYLIPTFSQEMFDVKKEAFEQYNPSPGDYIVAVDSDLKLNKDYEISEYTYIPEDLFLECAVYNLGAWAKDSYGDEYFEDRVFWWSDDPNTLYDISDGLEMDSDKWNILLESIDYDIEIDDDDIDDDEEFDESEDDEY